jgi:diguanylate cyclase (GGDEF)-like protein
MISEFQQSGPATFIILVRDIKGGLNRPISPEYQVVYDSLTGLPNRVLFYDRLHQAVLTGKRTNSPFSLFFIDLDSFQEVNESLGHYTGDWILQQIATRLCGQLRESDTVARLGGDEFGILLPTVDKVEEATLVADKIIEIVQQPIELDGQSFDIQASLGIALYPHHGRDAQSLIQRADLAMCTAKQQHRGTAVYRAQHERKTGANNLKLKSELHQAIINNELVIHYQPKIDMVTGKMVSAEALVRWQHPTHGLLGPDTFIPLAEQTGFIRPLSIWVMREALKQCREWRQTNFPVNVAVNISVVNLQDDNLPEQVSECLTASDADPEWLELEITETAVMTDPPHALEVLRKLDQLGIRLSIDDFGTGYASLTYLKKMPVNEIKIDKSFVLDVTDDQDDMVIIRATIDLAHNLGLSVVAEGVASHQAWCVLAGLKCDKAQGFYMSRPLTAPQLTYRLEKHGLPLDWRDA